MNSDSTTISDRISRYRHEDGKHLSGGGEESSSYTAECPSRCVEMNGDTRPSSCGDS